MADNLSPLKKRLEEIKKREELNLVRAINRGLKKGKTIFIRFVRDEVNIKRRDVAKRINIKQKATRQNPVGIIRGEHHRQGLITFGARKVRGGKPGVKVSVVKGGSGSILPKAFIAGTGNNRRVVIRRSNKKLKTLYSASVDQVLARNQDKVLAKVEDFVSDEFLRLTRAGV